MAGAQEKDLSSELGNKGGSTINVGKAERWMSGILGGALALWGIKQRGARGILAAAIGGSLIYRGAAGHCSMYSALGINTAQQKENTDNGDEVWERGIKVEHCITINRPPEELYHFWRKLENLPKIMHHLESVKSVGDTLSYWVAKAPTGMHVEWGAEIINEIENKLIAWKSLPEADVDNRGSVSFEPVADGQSTDVKISLQYRPPAGSLGVAVTQWIGESPAQHIEEDMQRFKAMMEAKSAEKHAEPAGHFA